jgi:hypothetical protein
VRYQANGYITGRDELRVVAVPQLDVNVVHEFCHAVSLSVSSTFANNPRWLWETVALYENASWCRHGRWTIWCAARIRHSPT